MTINQDLLDEVALSVGEYEAIVDRLDREPNPLELGLFGALWSEHCGYKHTKALLRTLPNRSERLMVAPGAENAGVVDIGDGYAVVFKIESHNHPSAVEPYEGAATGVGGIVRDILAMGARPMALMNSLRFGPPKNDRQRYLFNGVVSGISGYGNCIGIPNVGGEVFFDSSYVGNPLVNAMCVGIVRHGKLVSARAEAAGDLLVLVGAKTGRDGIHGASGLASRTFQEELELRSTVQVGNPFLEKVLIEACLEAIELPGVVGLQDCGAAGITSAAIEMAERSQLGIEIDVNAVPVRETEMSPYEVMLSESQERMLFAVKLGFEAGLFDLFEKWDLDAAVIGRFNAVDEVVVKSGVDVISTTPIETLTDAPEYRFSASKPDWLAELQSSDPNCLVASNLSPTDALVKLLESPNIASKHSVWRQYDHQVQNNTVIPPGGDAALLRIQGTDRALAVTTDGNGRYVYLNPKVGTAIAVAEACRNVSCVGATPVALTDGLNFGNPEKPDVQYQLGEATAGMALAAERLGVPVTSGNASLYNEAPEGAVLPTPIIGALGILEDVTKHVTTGFKHQGDVILLLGPDAPWGTPQGLSGSEAQAVFGQRMCGNPEIDLELEARLQRLVRQLIQDGLLKSAHDCALGGSAVAFAQSAIQGRVGVHIEFETGAAADGSWLASLFGEDQSRIVVSIEPDATATVFDAASKCGVGATRIGVVGGDAIQFGASIEIRLNVAADAWQNGLARAVSG